MRIDSHYARLGLVVIVVGAVLFRFLMPSTGLAGIGRLLVIILLALLAARGISWASAILIVFVFVGIVAALIGVTGATFEATKRFLFLLSAALYATGLTLFLLNGGSKAFTRSHNSIVTEEQRGT